MNDLRGCIFDIYCVTDQQLLSCLKTLNSVRFVP